MKVSLNALSNVVGAKKSKKRVGRGIGSSSGKTCGRGMKGQKSRSGVSIKTEGGQMPLIKRLPKRGFRSSKSISYKLINLNMLLDVISRGVIDPSIEITKEILFSIGCIKKVSHPVKILSGSLVKLDQKLFINVDAYSDKAKCLVENSGGSISILK